MLKRIKLSRLFRKVCNDDCSYIGLSLHKTYLRTNTHGNNNYTDYCFGK